MIVSVSYEVIPGCNSTSIPLIEGGTFGELNTGGTSCPFDGRYTTGVVSNPPSCNVDLLLYVSDVVVS